MECKFIKHGIALSYDQVVKPCCAWKLTPDWSQENHFTKIDLVNWHKSVQVLNAKTQLDDNKWPAACVKCKQFESIGRSDSMRGNSNSGYVNYKDDDITLEIRPGNVCNFACQTCWPAASSRVAEYHSRAGLIDIKSVNSTRIDNFDFLLPVADRIKDVILLGGEPFYDKSCLKFLTWSAQHLKSNITMFTNGSKIDFDFLKSYPGTLTLVFSIDAIGLPAEYIRYGTNWAEVMKNYLAVKELTNIDVRVNITCSVYNYLYIEEVINFLSSNWPSVVSFGKPNDSYLLESAVPIEHRVDMIKSLERAISIIVNANIESGQQSNAVNALTANITNLKSTLWSPQDYDQLCDFVTRMDQVKRISINDYCAALSKILK